MYSKVLFSILVVSICFALVSCERKRVTPTPEAGLANPASVYCEEQGGRLEIRNEANGGQVGFCIFPDGSECEEWAYFRGECAPGAAKP